jgi:ribose transport system ATP-binding protein
MIHQALCDASHPVAGSEVSKQAIVDAIVGDAHGKHVSSRREVRSAGDVFLEVKGLPEHD